MSAFVAGLTLADFYLSSHSQLKKLATIALLFVYATSITGIGLKAFYCCNELKSVSAVLFEKADKSKDGRDGTGCCRTTYSFFKVKDNHKSASEICAPLQAAGVGVAFVLGPSVYLCFSENTHLVHYSNGPPIVKNRPSFQLNCTYRI